MALFGKPPAQAPAPKATRPSAQDRQNQRRRDPYGSAQLLEAGGSDLTSILQAPRGVAGLPLGIDEPGSMQGLAWPVTTFQGHALTFGATRSGKGVSSIMPALLTYGGSVLVVDPKAESVWVTAERRRQMGQRVVIIDPWDETNRRYAKGGQVETLTRFNPLSALDPGLADYADDVAALADALVILGPGEPHWPESARELLGGLIAAVVEAEPGRGSFRQVRKLLTMPNEDFCGFAAAVVDRSPVSLAARKLARFTTDNRENSSIRSTAQTQTAILDSAALLDAMETDPEPFQLADLGEQPTTLFLVLPPDRLQTHGRWLRLMLSLTLRTIARRADPPALPLLMILDEAGSSLGNLAAVESAFGLLAGLGVRLWMFFQDLNQLKRDYPASWETFIANAAVIQVLTARDNTTSEYFSRFLGYETSTLNLELLKVIQERLRKEAQRVIHTGNDPSTSPKDPVLAGRALMDPAEIRELGANELLVLMPGLFNVRLLKLRYHQHTAFAGRFRPLPRFG